MVAIDFHVTAHKADYLCRLVRKAHRAGHRVAIYHHDASVIEALDRRLWSFSPTDFLPHCRAGDALAQASPIILLTANEPGPHHEVLVNCDLGWPPHFSRFDRLIELVGTDDKERNAGRVRWKFYRDRGYPLNYFDTNSTEPRA